MLSHPRFSLASALATLAALPALAQPPSPAPRAIELDPFPVVGTRLSSAESAATPNVLILDEAFIQRSGATDLAELVNLLPQTYSGAASGRGTVPNGSPSYGTATTLFNFTTGAAVPLRQTGVSSVGLSGLGAAGTLVLIDGRRLPLATQEDTASSTGAGFYDLSGIPLGLVERVEVLANGASAIHGSDAVGGVVNVVLRRNTAGSELITGFRATERGGALERHATLSSGFVRDRLNLYLSLTARAQDALKASQRPFSASQNQTALGGRDHRLVLGSPGILSARSGSFNSLTDTNGNPARHALVPEGQDGNGLAPADFAGSSSFFTSGLRAYDSAATKDLIGASDQIGLSSSATFSVSEKLQVFARVSWSDRTSETASEPPAISGGGFGGAQSLIPASDARNPFGQEVYFSGVLIEAPARPQIVDASLLTLSTGLSGLAGERWQWDVAASLSREGFDSRTLELNQSAFVAALADGRYNAFGDPATNGPLNADLNDEIMTASRIRGSSRVTGLDAFARGPLFTLPAGEVQVALGAETHRAQRHRISTAPVFGQPAEITSARTSSAAFAEFFVPLIGGGNSGSDGQGLSARLAARYERTDSFDETSPSLGLSWQPWRDVSIYASFAEGFRAPSLTEPEDVVYDGTSNINDPRLGGARYSVTRFRGGNPDVTAESSRTYQTGIILQPRFVSGIRLRGQLNETYYDNKLNVLPEQVLVDFEDRFAGRITRDASGAIASINATTINFGKVYTRSIDLGLSYEFDSDSLGHFRVAADAVRQLEYRVEDRPDRAGNETLDGIDTVSPPQWRGLARLFWNRGVWDATVMVSHLDGYESNNSGPFFDRSTTSPSRTTIDLRLGYTFTDGLWRGRGKNARIQVGVGNLADRMPPIANTPYGYNQSLHSPLGRTYDVTLRFPF